MEEKVINQINNDELAEFVFVGEEEFSANFEKTYYFQQFSQLDRYPDLDQAMEELMSLFEGEVCKIIQKLIDKHTDGSKIVTSVWT
jgi:hypothetical protein